MSVLVDPKPTVGRDFSLPAVYGFNCIGWQRMGQQNLLAFLTPYIEQIFNQRLTVMSLAACGWARLLLLFTNFASKVWSSIARVASRLERIVRLTALS
jgi:hypothetical protein